MSIATTLRARGPMARGVRLQADLEPACLAEARRAEAGEGQRDAVRLGLRVFLATVTMLFAAFTSAYLVRRGGRDWIATSLPPVLWWNTALLASSSVALEAAWRTGMHRQRGLASAAYAMTLLLGLGFVYGQFLAWQQLTAAGALLPSNPHASFFYMLTGAHALHVMAALGVLTWGAVATWRGLVSTRPIRWVEIMSTCRTFWHFLLTVWVYVFALLATG